MRNRRRWTVLLRLWTAGTQSHARAIAIPLPFLRTMPAQFRRIIAWIE
jgi:hypothetical protein